MSDDMTEFGKLVAKAIAQDQRDAQLARYCATIDQQREQIARLTAERDTLRWHAARLAIYDATDPGPVLVAETRAAMDLAKPYCPACGGPCLVWPRHNERAAMADDAEQPATVNEAEKRINDIISDIPHMSKPNRTRIRGALDKSEKPLEGRAADDAGLGRAIGRSAREPFSIGW